MRNIKLTIEFDGTNYSGWQMQVGVLTIQQLLQEAIGAVTGERIYVQGASRTDAGVHALAQVANFKTASKIRTDKLLPAINAHLPEDIVVKRLEEVPEDFHSQFHARSKLYRYTILNSFIRPALSRGLCHVVGPPLDETRMAEAAQCLVGEHDFRAFTTEAWTKTNTVRTVTAVRVERVGETITVEVEANGFLYNMVRAIVGTLIEIGRGKMEVAEMKAILDSRDRKKAGPTAPAKGLCLVEVRH